jgi:hypothetical protein
MAVAFLTNPRKRDSMQPDSKYVALSSDDLVPDEPLDRMAIGRIPAELDSLNHRVVARRIAELALTSGGHLNVALFGPWGSGKSSFYGLLRDSLADATNIQALRFDAWKNSGPGFQTNFLSFMAAEIPGADRDVPQRLFESTSSVRLPFGSSVTTKAGRRKWWLVTIAVAFTLFVALPAAWSLVIERMDQTIAFWPFLASNLSSWAGFAASSSILFVVLSLFLDLSRVTVQASTPSYVSQFSRLFDEILSADRKRRFVVFVDELDRCGSAEVMQTLEGLRTFLGHEQCVFVVAFDREAVANTIKKHLPNEVPNRPDRPYYSTSGEYLDKIFQFQVSLPPQPLHTFRRFALSLVEGRGGVWADLRKLGARELQRVVRILTPIHISSPRRTKVLLNDFAVNARILEALGFDWIERAEEIACLTVLQTEFPNFYADVEREPGLLELVATGSESHRADLQDLVEKYQGEATSELDEVVANDLDAAEKPTANDSDGGRSPREQVALRLNQNLQRFLRKIRDMNARLPRPDLVLMHSDGNLLSFEDLAVYNSLLLAVDASVEDTLASLASASEKDRIRALDYLLDATEGATADEVEQLFELIGNLAGTVPTANLAQASERLADAWDLLIDQDADLLWSFDETSIAGFVGAFAIYRDGVNFFEAFEVIREKAPAFRDGALRVLLERFSEPALLRDITKVNRAFAPIARNDITLTGQYLRRLEESGARAFSSAEVAAFAEGLLPRAPAEVAPEVANAAARAAAAAANEAALEAHAAEVATGEIALREIVKLAEGLPGASAVRGSVRMLLRKLGDNHAWTFDAHDDLIRGEIAAGFGEQAGADLVRAVSIRPRHATRWLSLIPTDTLVPWGEIIDAEDVLFKRALDSRNSELARVTASTVALAVSSVATPSGAVPSDLVDLASRAATTTTVDPDSAEFGILPNLIDALAHLGVSETDLAGTRSNVLLNAALFAPDVVSDEVVARVRACGPLASELLRGEFTAELDEIVDEDEHLARVTYALAATIGAAGRVEVNAIPGEAVLRAAENGLEVTSVEDWVRSAPPVSDLDELSDDHLRQVSATAWGVYSDRASPTEREAVWLRLAGDNANVEVLRSVASAGVPDSHYKSVANLVDESAPNATKVIAIAQLRSLPQHNSSSAREAVRVAERLWKDGSGLKSDLPLVAALLLDNSAAFNNPQRTRLRGLLTPWVEGATSYLAKKDIAKLRDAKLIEQKSAFDTLLKRLSGR